MDYGEEIIIRGLNSLKTEKTPVEFEKRIDLVIDILKKEQEKLLFKTII